MTDNTLAHPSDRAFVPSGSSQSSLSRPEASIPCALPADYRKMSPQQRRAVREEYIRLQDGKCYHCGGDLAKDPPKHIAELAINWKRFPPNFLRWPAHLHHDHRTGLTIGTVHARCNAVLWQYHGE